MSASWLTSEWMKEFENGIYINLHHIQILQNFSRFNESQQLRIQNDL